MSARGGVGALRAALCGLALAGLSAGCWETPSQEWYEGVDVGIDGGGCDAGCCGADCGTPDGGRPPRPQERVCDDRQDNDDDGLEDCADFDCADHASCCADGALLFQEDWNGADLTFLWDHLPRASPTSSPAREVEDDVMMLRGWEDDTPHTLAFHRCLPLALGAELSFEVIATARESVCDTWYDTCDKHAAVVLSPVRDTSPGQALLDDLAIRVHGHKLITLGEETTVINQAMVRITQAGNELGRLLIEPEVRYRATLRLTPSSQGSLASLRADLELRRADAAPTADPAMLSVPFVIAQDRLVKGTSGCMEVGGLYAAVEMVGDGARLGPLRAEALECVNPSQFQTAPMGTTTLTSESLGVPASYGGAHVGAPTLGSSFNNVSDSVPRWDLFFEATNEAPELERLGPVIGYAIAHARSATFGALPADWTTSATPRLGSDPPSCLVSGTCSGESVREPFLLLRRGADDVLEHFTLAFAAKAEIGGHTLRVEQDVTFSPTAPLGGMGMDLQIADAECVDLRDPALLPVNGGGGGYWLFFTCVRAGDVGEIRAARFNSSFERQGDAGGQRVIAPVDVGAIAVGGVFGAEPVVRSNANGLMLQVWLVARDGQGRTSLVLMTGQLPAVEGMDGGVSEAPSLDTLPTLDPYLANPVLRSDDPALGGCPGLCRITGVAVSDTAGEHDELRFVVARRVVVSADDVFSELVPLTQMWRSP